MSTGRLQKMPQLERPEQFRFHHWGIHDHHINAARTEDERTHAKAHPNDCYDDERCWWDGGNGEW